jgi:hypothetical protein
MYRQDVGCSYLKASNATCTTSERKCIIFLTISNQLDIRWDWNEGRQNSAHANYNFVLWGTQYKSVGLGGSYLRASFP